MSEARQLTVFEKNISVSGCRFTRTAMYIDRMDEETLVSAGAMLQTVEGSRAWWWGDFIGAWCKWKLEQDEKDGEREPDEKVRQERMVRYASQYAAVANVEPGTINQWRVVSAFFEPLSRLKDLSWAHHQEAYHGSGGDLAVAQNWLDQAQRNSWSKSQLRAAIRAAKRAEAQPEEEPGRQILFPELDRASIWARAAINRVPDMDAEEMDEILADLAPLLRLAETLAQARRRLGGGKESFSAAA